MRRCTVQDVNFDLVPANDKPDTHRQVADTMMAVALYLNQFQAPEMVPFPNMFDGSVLCSCGKALDGMSGTFTSDPSMHSRGEGVCSNCQTPIRLLHQVQDAVTGKTLVTLRVPLLFHPDTPANQPA